MEEDVEIEILFKSNEKILMEAAKETNAVISREINQLENHTLSSVGETKSSCNKENVTVNMVHDHEERFYQLTETAKKPEKPPQIIDSNVEMLSTQDKTYCNFDHFSKMQNNFFNIVNDEPLHNVNCFEGADDQVNQHILDLIATDPVKYRYYLSQQTSCITQFEEGDDDDDDDSISSDDDWDDDFGYQDDDFIDDMLEEPQFKSVTKSQFSGNKTLQKLETKALPPLTTLGKMLLKRGSFLSAMEIKLQQLSQENKDRQKELQDILMGADKIKISESSSLKCCYKKFGMPYFSDDKGFCAPPNNDHQKKLENDEIIIQSIPKTINWIKPHKDMMKNAIKKSLIAEKSAKLAKEITKLTEIVTHKNGKANKNALEKITEKQNELRGLYKKSFKELVGGENDNREYDWMRFSVSLFDGLHSAEECKRFWNIYLKPSINKDPWSDSEDYRLLEIIVQLEYQDWESIAKLLGTNRTGFQCFVHYKARLEGRSDCSSGKWTQVEDKKLMTVVNSSKMGNFIPWTKVSSYMGNRNHNQIYNRWANSLNPELVKGRFSKEEDLLIVAGVEVFGVTFKELSLFMNNRTCSQVRERYERHLLPKTAKVGAWSFEEDDKLLKLVQNYGHNWSKIAKEIKTRTRTQVRQRYAFIQKMKRKKPDWTIAQVKRRNMNLSKRVIKTNKDVKSMKKLVGEIEKVFHLSDIDKETYLLDKLAELRAKISSRNSSSRGRRKKDFVVSSQVNDALLDRFTNRYTNSLTKTATSIHNDTDSRSNELFMLNNVLGHKLRLPKSETEVWENPRLSLDSKFCLYSVLNTDVEDHSSISLSKQQSCSSILSSIGKRDSMDRIDCPIPEHDNTIIMMDWWHTPPVNVANLNFSEFFKRTVFDYSNGMHKDIWESKVKRSQMVHSGYDCSGNGEDELPTKQSYNCPPNQFTTLGKRTILLSRAILERQEKDLNLLKQVPYNFFKKEVNEDTDVNVVIQACNQFENNLLTLFTWPKVLTVTKFGTVPLQSDHCSKKRQQDLQENLITNIGTSLGLRKSCINNEQEEQKLTVDDVTNSEHIVEKRKLDNLTANDVTHSEHKVKKRKLGNELSDTVKKTNQKNQKTSRSKCVKKSKRCTTHKEKNHDHNLSNMTVSRPLESSNFTYSKLRSSTKNKSCT